MSYLKRAAATSAFGHVGDAGMQLDGTAQALVGQWVGFEACAIAFALSIVAVFVYRHRIKRVGTPLQLPR